MHIETIKCCYFIVSKKMYSTEKRNLMSETEYHAFFFVDYKLSTHSKIKRAIAMFKMGEKQCYKKFYDF